MYTQQQKDTAIKAYFKNQKNAAQTVRELGYPTVPALLNWIKASHLEPTSRSKKETHRYTEDEKQKAVDLYIQNNCNLKKTVRELGYGSATGVLRWIRERRPDKASKIVPRAWKVDYPEEIKQKAIMELVNQECDSAKIAEKYGISRATLYEWKINYIGKGNTALRQKINSESTEEYSKEVQELKEQLEAIKKELHEAKKQLYKAQLEKDVYEKAAEILKKEIGCSLKNFTNREKAMVIAALKDKYPVKEILEVFEMAKSSYFYQKNQLKKEDKYEALKNRIIELFEKNKGRYGYRRIHFLLQKEGIKISEKIVRRIMRNEHLVVRITRRKKYRSYMGEISPAVENKVHRDFHAEKPNEKWLTDITEFAVGKDEKVYLSPMIDCFDGMPVAWTIGTSPNADLVNQMLEEAISTLKDNEHPIVHSDRGCHYRWPGWIERMENAHLIRSMSKKGCSPDNSACEGFFGRLKVEMFYGFDWSKTSATEFMGIVNEYMRWYIEDRVKLSLGGMSIMENRRSLGLV